MESLGKSVHFLHVLNDCSFSVFKAIISEEKQILKILLEIVVNIAELRIPLSPEQNKTIKNNCCTFILNVYKFENSEKDLKNLFLKNDEQLKYMISIFLGAYKSYG